MIIPECTSRVSGGGSLARRPFRILQGQSHLLRERLDGRAPARPGPVGLEPQVADPAAPRSDDAPDRPEVGAVGVLQLDRPVDVAAATQTARDQGVWIRPFRDLVYTMPPYVTPDADLATLTAGLVGAVEDVHG